MKKDGVGTIGKAGAEARPPPRASLPRLPGARDFPGLCRVPSHGPIGRAPSGGDVPSRTPSAVWKVGTVTPITPTCCEDSVRMYLKRPCRAFSSCRVRAPGANQVPAGWGWGRVGQALERPPWETTPICHPSGPGPSFSVPSQQEGVIPPSGSGPSQVGPVPCCCPAPQCWGLSPPGAGAHIPPGGWRSVREHRVSGVVCPGVT